MSSNMVDPTTTKQCLELDDSEYWWFWKHEWKGLLLALKYFLLEENGQPMGEECELSELLPFLTK